MVLLLSMLIWPAWATLTEISPAEFVQHHTDGGALYHGTKISAYQGILREGIRHTSLDSFGFYTTPQYAYAAAHAFGYHSDRGVVIPVRLRPDVRVAVLDSSDETTGEEAAARGFDVLVKPLAQGEITFHTNGTKVQILNVAKIIMPAPATTVGLAAERVRLQFEAKQTAEIGLRALGHLRDTFAIEVPDLGPAIASARARASRLTLPSITRICAGKL